MNETGSYLYRLRFLFEGGGATRPMIWAHAAGWVFRQKPEPASADGRTIGVEVETRRHPILARRALEKATGRSWNFEILWSRPARPWEGEGPEIGEDPWVDGWPARTD